MKLILLSLFITFNLSFASIASSEKNAEEQLREQALIPFSKKFAVITNNIEELSQNNLEYLNKTLIEKRPQFKKYLELAEEQLTLFDNELEIQHETSFESVLKILESQKLLSVDELVRQGKMPALKKHKGLATKDTIDGAIGEQDVVFLAIKPRDYNAEFSFGEITLKFAKDKLLSLGYFTPFAFNSGHPRNDNLIPDGLPLYKRMIFSGKKAYLDFLKLSIAEVLWENDQNFKSANDLILKFQEKNKNTKNGTVSISEISDIFKQLGQVPSNVGQAPSNERCIPVWQIDQLVMNRITAPSGKLGKGTQAISAFHGFPISENNDPLFLAKNWNFWELKIPTSLDLTYLSSLEFDQNNFKTEEITRLQKAIYSYALTAKKKIKTSSKGTILIYTFEN